MAIGILVCSLLFALAGAGLGVFLGLTVWGCLALAGLLGNLAAITLVSVVLWRTAREESRQERRRQPRQDRRKIPRPGVVDRRVAPEQSLLMGR